MRRNNRRKLLRLESVSLMFGNIFLHLISGLVYFFQVFCLIVGEIYRMMIKSMVDGQHQVDLTNLIKRFVSFAFDEYLDIASVIIVFRVARNNKSFNILYQDRFFSLWYV